MLLMLGVAFLIVADIVLATAVTAWQVFVGVVLWGLHIGATQGLLSTLGGRMRLRQICGAPR
jgi:hypothetical protein